MKKNQLLVVITIVCVMFAGVINAEAQTKNKHKATKYPRYGTESGSRTEDSLRGAYVELKKQMHKLENDKWQADVRIENLVKDNTRSEGVISDQKDSIYKLAWQGAVQQPNGTVLGRPDVTIPMFSFGPCDSGNCDEGVKAFLSRVMLIAASDAGGDYAKAMGDFMTFASTIQHLDLESATSFYAGATVYYKMFLEDKDPQNELQKSQRKMVGLSIAMLDQRMNFILENRYEWKKYVPKNTGKSWVENKIREAHLAVTRYAKDAFKKGGVWK
jgi:hypothetical protein